VVAPVFEYNRSVHRIYQGASRQPTTNTAIGIVPDLARGYTASRDGLLYTFNLRRDVTFQDGTPLDAAAYVATFKRLLDPCTKAAAQAVRLGPVSAVTATGKYSFTVQFEKRVSDRALWATAWDGYTYTALQQRQTPLSPTGDLWSRSRG
jgi:ABC-type transport system substrate-binding protein